ncbi:MAG: DUF484 family protein [Celeribacter sp.]|jgi:uncharacterized protein YigA (DUF484 family)
MNSAGPSPKAEDAAGTDPEQDALRARILAQPDLVLEDHRIMRALIAANEKAMGGNIVDLRGIAMERLEARLDRLEDTHRSVIAAAYDNLAGTNQVHRAILAMLDPTGFEAFLRNLGTEVATILRVDSIRLVLETDHPEDPGSIERLGDVLAVVRPGFIDAYLTGPRGRQPIRPVTLRQATPEGEAVYGERGNWIRSEALLRLDLGEDRLPGLLALGAEDPHQFTPAQGTDLLTFFGGVFERQMRRWLG